MHEVDLAERHLSALEHVFKKSGFSIFNMERGIGFSVLEIINEYEIVNLLKVPYILKKSKRMILLPVLQG